MNNKKNTISLIKIEYSFIKKNHENNLFYHKTKKKEHLKVNRLMNIGNYIKIFKWAGILLISSFIIYLYLQTSVLISNFNKIFLLRKL